MAVLNGLDDKNMKKRMKVGSIEIHQYAFQFI